MPALDRTRALIAEFGSVLGLDSLPPDENGGYHLTVGADTDIMIYGGDDETVLVVAPVAPLPHRPEYGLMVYLLRNNMFDSPVAPFQVAVDDEGALILWARLPLAELSGSRLASIIRGLAEQVGEMRGEIATNTEAAA
jgi:hypothetical protein